MADPRMIYIAGKAFYDANGPPKLLLYHQTPETSSGPDGEFAPVPGAPKKLFLTSGEVDSLREHALYFIRVNPKGVTEKTVEQDVMAGEVRGGALASFRALVSNLFVPVLAKQHLSVWGKNTEEGAQEFVHGAAKFGAALAEAATSLKGGVELKKPDKTIVPNVDIKPADFAVAATDVTIAGHFEDVLEDWCEKTEALLSENESERRESADAGPDTELEYWRSRMAKFNSITEQLKSKECRTVLGVAVAARSKAHRRWKDIDMAVTDAANESKDNVKYLTTLEKPLEPLYVGTPQAIVDGLPVLLNSVKMMHTVARYYATPERMTTLFRKISNQLVTRCSEFVGEGGNLWNQNRPALLDKMRLCVKMEKRYKEEYAASKERLAQQPKGRQFDFDNERIFIKFELFIKRCNKLLDLYSTIMQFTALASNTHIDGMGDMIKKFFLVVEELKRKPYDLLDFTKNAFDRDYLEFNVHVHELETNLQDFINASFENITSTEHALNLLRQFQEILHRDSLRRDLDNKYMVIFKNYAQDLDAVQKIYEKSKHSPTLPRNAPPVAGDIMWSRQLLRRIEEPMRKFATNETIMKMKDSKRTVKTYNTVAKALVAFETLWLQAWVKSIESSKAGLQATLIVKHPETGDLLVNFDKEIIQLMRETRYLQRMGIEVPESAKMVLLQEEKFKEYYNQLSYALKEYDRVMDLIVPVVKPLMKSHLDDIEKKLHPGMYVLTWSSMNIDGYLHRVHKGLAHLELMIGKVNDMLENRIDANLKAVARLPLVTLPSDESFTFDDFLSRQSKHVKKQTAALVVKNSEIERGCADLCDLIASFPLDGDQKFDAAKVQDFTEHYAKLMYQAILAATRKAFAAMKKRLGSRSSGGFLFVERPFFDVDVELTIPNVSMNPTLEDIQGAINATAKKVLKISESLHMWGGAPGKSDGRTFHEWIASDKEIVKSVLLLTGSIEGTKAQVMEYIGTFSRFDFLYMQDLQAEYKKFMDTSPSLEAFENELKKYMAIEDEIQLIAPVHNIGAMSLETQPMKYSLKAEAAAWKKQFAKNLHSQGKQQLKQIHDYMRETTLHLNRKIEDLEDVRKVMGVLKEIRDRESDIDSIMVPIEEIYALLGRYQVVVPKEETETVSELRYGWNKMKVLAVQVTENLGRMQVGFKRELIKEVKVFVVDAVEFRADWDANGPAVPGLEPMEAVARLKKFTQMFEVRKRKWDNYSSGEELFGLSVTQYPELEKTEKELALLDRLYGLFTSVLTTIDGYADILWTEVVSDMDAMTEQVTQFQAQCRKLPKSLRDWQAYEDCRRKIDEFLEMLPLLQALGSKDVRPRHWDELMTLTGVKMDLSEETFKLSDLLGCGLLKVAEEVEELTAGAVKEAQVETKLASIDADWAEVTFAFQPYKNRGEVCLAVAPTAELIEKLEDSQMALGSMATNRYSAPFKEEVHEWIAKLSTVGEIIEMWLVVQNMWMYMEAVFSGGDIVKQLPLEAKRFQNIDKQFIKAVQNAVETQNVVEVCYVNDLMTNTLPILTEQLELCQKSLTAFLDTKRAEFPRFYFVSDPTLLEILSLGSDPQSVTPHFQSGLFDSLTEVTFDKVDKTKMLEMFSQQGECVKFIENVDGILEPRPVIAQGNIEVWLQSLVDGMQRSIRGVIKMANSAVHEQDLETFIFGHPAQISLLGIQFLWTSDMQGALSIAKKDKTAMQKAFKKQDGLLKEMIVITTRSNLGKNERKNLETVITVHVHQRDTSEDLMKKKVRDIADFEWAKQCRFYWRDEMNTVIISICDVDFEYSYEYLGVKERLVITPLTDICYVTLSQALGMFLGGAPAGPAGTGKTETTKDLGNTLGKFVVVFNCSDQMDYKGMGKIYRGLAQSGLWGCFDEFNRINLDVLSVCAQQVFCVLQAIRERKKQFIFTDGAKVSLDPRVGFFITMNPGYAGRQELPENLKSLFRGVTMMVPDRQIIKKVKLAACGYQQNEFLAKKFFVLYGLCEQQLSKQAHYDFGLRNILSVLRTMGASKRENPGKSEIFLAMRSLRDMNMSKFVAEDVTLFLSLIGDIFPGVKADKATFPDIEAAMAKVATERGLQLHPTWLSKCVQLYETYLVRHGIMVVGPTGAGKTAICETLAGALTETGVKHNIWRMNPKAITAPQMFGRMDAATGDWTEGVFAVLWRRAAKEKKNNTWIVLDGPVDAIWIENLNTVLDDNKVLTLANGDRVQMSGTMKAMFEPENLNNASPATVSRAGIIFVSETELTWKPVVASWLATRKATESAALAPLFEKYVDELTHEIAMTCKPVMSGIPWEHVSRDFCSVTTLLTMLKAVLGAAAPGGESLSEGHYERLFIYCTCWAIGGMLPLEDRPKFNKKLVELSAGNTPAWRDEERDTFFEYYVDDENAEWNHWADRVPDWHYPVEQETPKFASLVIPTLDSVRLEYVLKMVSSVGKSSLFVGGPGTAKTTTIQSFMDSFDPEEMASKAITFSSLTTPEIFQVTVEASVEKRQGRTFGPPGGKKLLVFVDDISMPAMNDWGDQTTNEIVRQLLEQGGMYSLEKPIGDMKMIVDCQYLAAMNTPGGGKNDIPNRLKRHFAIFNVPLPSVAAINNIFGQLVAGRFAADACGEDLHDAALKLVPITIELWNKVQTKMLPTPAKFHYLFNMRELSKVFQGLILAERDRFKLGVEHPPFGGDVTTPDGYLVAAWRHECERVFVDKLTTYEDKNWTDELITSIIKKTFSSDITKQVKERVYFVDFLRPPIYDEDTGETIDANPSFYESTISLDAVKIVADEKMRLFNETSKTYKLDLVLFQDALLHMMRIARLLAMDRGSALLVGVGGSGKQSLTRLAAYISGAFTFQITISKQYNQVALFEDLKALYKVAGLKGQKVCFIFTDAEIKDEGFLEFINQILMTGEVAGLFPKDEMDMILNDMRAVMKREAPSIIDTMENLYAFFMGRVRDNLHTCLCFSPVGDKFSTRARNFPGLINGCTIDWFLPWPQEALIAVSTKFIGDFQMACDDKAKHELQKHMGFVHVAVTRACKEYFEKFRRNVYVTPKSYLSFIDGYRALYQRKLDEVKQLADKINSGLNKLFEAKADVKNMQIELTQKNKDLAVAQKDAADLLKEISASTAIAEKEKARVAVIVEGVSAKADEISIVKEDAERDLAAAKPALDAAVEALNSISAKDIGALKALKNPPDVVKRIFDAVLVLRQFPMSSPVTWHDVKGAMVINGSDNYKDVTMKMMGDTQFLGKLMAFPKEQINDETCELLEPYLQAPDFNFEMAQKASGSVAGLCNWCEAMKTYHFVAKVVDPKIIMLRAAEAELKVAMKAKQAAEDELAKVQANLDEMQAKFDAAMAQKQALEDDAAACQRKMEAATTLISALAGEEVRWTEQSKQFDLQIQRLTGDCALASSFVSYLGPFNKEFRDLLLSRDFYGDCVERGIPVTENLDVTRFLVDESEIGEWNLQGLPTDELSIQNGIMVTRATRYPVLVDPQGQGTAWIKSREEMNMLRVTSLGEKQFRNHLEDAMSYGKPMLIENIEEELDPMLDPVLEKRVVRKGKSLIIQMDKEIDFTETFSLFCTTRLPNPHYSPEMSAKVTIIDFTVTAVGLEDQLLGKLILKEKHELEEQRQALVEEVTSYKKKIKQLEDDLLFRLSNSTGNLLDDVELIDVLNNTKQTAQDVNEKLATASETNIKITEACEEYRPVAHRATLIYFLIAEFATCNVMYQTSLKQFNQLYELAIDNAEQAKMPAKRIANIISHMTYSIYLYIQRGLFERHKLTFALMMTNKILVSSGELGAELVSVFLKGGGSLDIKSVARKPKDWIPDRCWLDIVALSKLPSFSDILESFQRSDGLWRRWYDLEAPEGADVPDFQDRITKFEKMMIVKALREDRTMVAAQEYIADAIGQQFVESVPLSMEKTWEETTPFVPVICILSPGADPTKLIEELAKRKKIKMEGVSMGQGQEIVARKMMTTATLEGQWVLLQNTHLGLNYLTEVETYLTKAEELHEDFRLWITAEPHPEIPIGLLQMSIKLTNEAPVGMRAGLRNSYAWVNQDMLDAVGRYEWRQMLFVMCYMHSIVQERRKFGPIGWNILYEFNQSDLSACVQFLQNHTMEMDAKKLNSPTWPTVTYMISQIQYGGRITDPFDELLMDTYAGQYFNKGSLEKGLELFKGYVVPDETDIAKFRAAIEDLPSQESPEIFGLHPNADLTFRTLAVAGMIDTVVSTMPKAGGGGGGMSPEETVDGICEDLLGKVPSEFQPEVTKELLRKLPGGPTQPLTVHLRQEIDRLNIIINLTTKTLRDLRLAIAGTIALAGDLVEALDKLFNASIPSAWLKKSWESSTIGSWFQGLLRRHDQLDRWLHRGRPKGYWLTGFFNPQGFLTAMKQEVNRLHAKDKWALDDVVMTSEVTNPPKEIEQLKDEPKEGVYVYGLFLEGCRWDGKMNCLVDSEPKKLFTPLPVLYVTGVQQKDKPTKNVFEAPTYKVKKRTGLNFITTFTVRTQEPTSKWVMRGVALLASVD
ncbi:flagellar outer dynein arm heavy chain gamma [Micromonas pusilla CCMP1545]|uniref:Flagellar outer dynein arm heavy chain gamma n=2 Tax=Micromonas pusilla TaxID=38833 RepID=C1MWH4_MICPC|nr:flagellar outer dynein arm heavy chain gamma [Micromonas pusilla CCMP1545]EEH55878.1 flagellar outer dynein arm heavy chain gamma [Micromonas pusilla CCMP1545]|eukprot:XP_003059926.1 flagellar outer dynein arm heavy chain gamma [Micromonas pusilla CCMP1545]